MENLYYPPFCHKCGKKSLNGYCNKCEVKNSYTFVHKRGEYCHNCGKKNSGRLDKLYCKCGTARVIKK